MLKGGRLLLIVFVLSFSSAAAQARDINFGLCSLPQSGFSKIVKDLTPLVVNVSTTQTVETKNELALQFPPGSPFEDLFKDFFERGLPNNGGKKTVTSLGSGFVLSKDGYIITNNHVIDGAETIEITFADGEVATAEIIGHDERTDIALLKVTTTKDLPFVKFGDSDASEVGDWIIAIGNPFGLGGTVTAGIISARGRNINNSGSVDFIQTDAAINRGNSGGPMFNLKGELIGINTAIYSNSGGNIGIGFAIPGNTAQSIIKQLKETGKVLRGWLGVNIQAVTKEIAGIIGLEKPIGAYVVNVTKDSPAEKGGLKVDDVIIEFNGKVVEEMIKLPRMVGNTPIGTKVKLVVLRKDKIGKYTKTPLKITIGEFKEEKVQAAKSEKLLGISLAEITTYNRQKYNISEELSGVLIVDVDSEASQSGLQAGDLISKINHQPVKTVEEVKKIIDVAKEQKQEYILLSLLRGSNTRMVVTLKIK